MQQLVDNLGKLSRKRMGVYDKFFFIVSTISLILSPLGENFSSYLQQFCEAETKFGV